MPWISRDDYLTQSEMENNVTLARNYLHSIGWSDNAIAGLCGNMQYESSISPGRKEITSGTWTPQNGYGLCMWTPATKLFNWLSSKGYTDRTNGNYQLEFVDTVSSQWGPSGDPHAPSVQPPITWAEYRVSTLSPITLAEYFMFYWEKPAYDPQINMLEKRKEWAGEWYTYITGQEPGPPEPTPGGFPHYLICAFKKRGGYINE